MDPSGEVCLLECEEGEIRKNGIIVIERPIKVKSAGGVLGLIRERGGFGDFSELRKKVQAGLEKKHKSWIDMASGPAEPPERNFRDDRICCIDTTRMHFSRIESKEVTVTDKRRKLKVTFEYLVATWYESRTGKFVLPEDCPENRKSVNAEEIWDLSELILGGSYPDLAF